MDTHSLHLLETLCADVMRCDQYRLKKRLHPFQQQLKKGQPLDNGAFTQLTADIEKSLKRRQSRALNLPKPQFPDDLPVSVQREDIATVLAANQVIILAGETGSGKTTQLPKICLTLGRGIAGLIGCTQPRRIAARTVANRVASELDSPLGHTVGYKIRFSDHVSENTYIKFMTDGILLAETQSDRFLEMYDTLIIDEAHERSLNIDFLLGYLKQLLPKRPDLKLIITSATIDTARFSEHFAKAPVLTVSGRTYPVSVRYLTFDEKETPDEDRRLIQGIVNAVDEITLHDRHADMLIFLSGERDIRDATEALRKHHLPNTEILPLYARLSVAEQNRVFAPGSLRRIVLATNVAETSLTVPRIKAVIDSGLARISRYSLRSKVQRLPIEKISRSSADQRKGRCGRIAPGLCIRLYSEEDYQQRPEFTDPEILRTSLASVILQMLFLRLGDVHEFPFIDPPSTKMINDGFTLLIELGAVDAQQKITPLGRQLAKLPIDPRIGRMILAATQEQCLTEVLIIASALSIQDPRERPLEAQEAADTAQKKFDDERSDFLSFIKLWTIFHEQARHLSKNKLRQWCQAHFLSYLRLREWQDIYQQLHTLLREMGWQLNQVEADYDAIHRALLTGLLGNIAFKTQEDYYLGTRSLKLYLFPGSGLFKKPPKWLVAAELVETTRLYARSVAKINPDWIEPLAGFLCQRQYFEPHWEKKVAQVAAYEKVTLYGLTLVAQRKINYGPLDPPLAREIFIRHALVQGEFQCTAQFFQHNHDLVKEIETLEHKARRQDILVDEETIVAFYAARIPVGVYCGKTFDKWRKEAERQNPKLLFLTPQDLIQPAAELVTPQAFPDYIFINGMSLPLSYHFEPGHPNDGVTVDIPLALLNQLAPQPFTWLVPGLLEEKLVATLRSLPKALRKTFVPIPDVAREILEILQKPTVTFREGGSFLEYPKVSFYESLTIPCQRRLGSILPPDIWQVDNLEPHLRINFRLLDNTRECVDAQRDLILLQQKWGTYASQTCQQEIAENSGLERDKLTTWNFGHLPAQVDLTLKGVTLQGFPTLVDQETHVALRVLDDPAQAQQQLRLGLRRLFLLALPTKKLLKQLPIQHKLCLQYLKIGNCEKLREDLFIASVETVFLIAPLPATQPEFEQRLATGNRRLLPVIADYMTVLVEILTEYTKLTQQFGKLTNVNKIVSSAKEHLHRLVYDGFVREIPLTHLKQIPRYLNAIQIRLERFGHDPHKDAKKWAQLMPLWEAYWQHLAQQETVSAELLEFRWLLEELRVSLFAQELKTVCPVSVQKLEKMWSELS